jgi:hypothetical protein
VDNGVVDIMSMTAHTVHLPGSPVHRSFRLTQRELRTEEHDDVVLSAAEARELLAAARDQDVSVGGCFSPGPAGVQLWDGPWNGAGGRVGTAEHLGSVDWSWDAPDKGFVTVYRVLLTAKGVRAGLTTQTLLDLVLSLSGMCRPASLGILPMPRLSTDTRVS